MSTPRLPIAITPGDPEGIGPEITWKAIRKLHASPSKLDLICIGAAAPFKRLRAPVEEITLEEIRAGLPRKRSAKPAVRLLRAPDSSARFLPGFQSGWSIEVATRLAIEGKIAAIVTGPISKERLNRGGYPYPGHTEMLATLCRADGVTMMLANSQLRISLVTTHLALRDVPDALTPAEIRRAVAHTADSLRQWWGIRKPRIAVAALNPHAGEGGLFGREDIDLVGPTLEAIRQERGNTLTLEGPLPADTLFANHIAAPKNKRFDAVVCLYHDQGLIPVKLLDFSKTVNVSLGLPIVRTSVDHGVAFDIAGKGVADASSLLAAIDLAAQIIRHQKKGSKK